MATKLIVAQSEKMVA